MVGILPLNGEVVIPRLAVPQGTSDATARACSERTNCVSWRTPIVTFYWSSSPSDFNHFHFPKERCRAAYLWMTVHLPFSPFYHTYLDAKSHQESAQHRNLGPRLTKAMTKVIPAGSPGFSNDADAWHLLHNSYTYFLLYWRVRDVTIFPRTCQCARCLGQQRKRMGEQAS